jgi:GT2 family glycosyltransferase
MSLSKVSIIIINYNGKNLLETCLESLFKIDYTNFEVILVDNNSTDNSIEFITKNYPSIIIIKLDSNQGFAEPNNIASKIAKGKYLLFLNNDTIVTPKFISKMVEAMENDTKIGICQSMLLKFNGIIDSSGDFIDELGVVYNSKSEINSVREISSARGASMLIKKNFFDELDGFDESFFVSFEDVDLGWRTWIKGFKVIVVPESIVYHDGGNTVKKIKSEIAFHGFKNQLIMKLTNFESHLVPKIVFSFLIIYGMREIRIWLDYIFKGYTKITPTNYEKIYAQKPNFKIILKSLFWLFQNNKKIFKKHKIVNSTRKLSTKILKQKKILSNTKQ